MHLCHQLRTSSPTNARHFILALMFFFLVLVRGARYPRIMSNNNTATTTNSDGTFNAYKFFITYRFNFGGRPSRARHVTTSSDLSLESAATWLRRRTSQAFEILSISRAIPVKLNSCHGEV